MAVDPELGYDPGDQFYYSRELVRELLPMALDGPVPPAGGLSEGGRSVADPATGGNVLAMIVDVRRALVYDGAWGQALTCHLKGQDFPDWLLDEIIDRLGGPK
jgi:hypothetical protein